MAEEKASFSIKKIKLIQGEMGKLLSRSTSNSPGHQRASSSKDGSAQTLVTTLSTRWQFNS